MSESPLLCRDDKHGAVVLTEASTFDHSGGHIYLKGACSDCGLTRGATLNDQEIVVLLNAIIHVSPAISCTFTAAKRSSGEYTPLCACG